MALLTALDVIGHIFRCLSVIGHIDQEKSCCQVVTKRRHGQASLRGRGCGRGLCKMAYLTLCPSEKLCTVVALALVDRRDFGVGLIADRPGPGMASRSLLSPFGLAWRLNRGATHGWMIGSAVFGQGIGTLGKTVNDAMTANAGAVKILDQLASAGVANLVDTFYAAMMKVYGVLAAGFVVQAMLRLRSEEAGGPAEAVLATAVGRVRWVIAHLALFRRRSVCDSLYLPQDFRTFRAGVARGGPSAYVPRGSTGVAATRWKPVRW
ncbi:hypothetical protein [Nonomuraea turcica]|uniref:hypothetical protein n=1 Tax=Nonomuraea sp. G32 TaxID=3067274 RepID=UPI00273C17C3|nr:hypothetical protein [Nonomuraea sp. G32]MDP4503328.1 hypothetical protein [Nonomuraea sp. G32]